MQREQNKLRGAFVLAGLLLVVALVSACTSPAQAPASAPAAEKVAPVAAKPAATAITLKSATAWPKNAMDTEALWRLEKELKARGSGITFNYVGGPEAIPSFELVEAIRAGTVDIAITPHTYNATVVPAALAAHMTTFTPWEDREKGVYDLLNQAYQEKGNMFFLGRGAVGSNFRLYVNKEVKSSADFKGLRIRLSPLYKAFVEALGAQAVTMPPGDVYTAVERNVVDGYGWPEAKISDFGWQEVTKFAVEPTFYVVDISIVMNLDSWKKLPNAEQDHLIAAMKKVERDLEAWENAEIEKETKLITTKGVKIVTVSDPDKYTELAYKAGWDEILAKVPDYGPKLKEAMSKK